MVTLLFALCLLLLGGVLGLAVQNRKRAQHIAYLTQSLCALLQSGGPEYLRLVDMAPEEAELASTINRLLEAYHGVQAAHRQAEQMRKQMLTNISHDIKTPLTVISGYTQVLQNQVQGQEGFAPETKRLLQRLADKTEDTVRLVTQFFTMAKLESGDLALQPTVQDLCECCRSVLLESYDLLDSRRCHVEIDLPEKPVFLCFDRQAVERILKNLIDNAIRHGGDGRYLGLALREDAQSVALCVEDHGKGIAPDKQALIFDRAYFASGRADSSGLGLAIAGGLAKRMGGSLRVQSVPHEKTVFTLQLKK